MMYGSLYAGSPFASSYSIGTGLCGPLGKTMTCGEIEDRVRADLRMVDSPIPSQKFLDLINISCDEFREKLGIAKNYICFVNLGVGTSFDLSSVKMRGIYKVTDTSAGLVKMVSPEEYERLAGFDQYDNSVIGTHEGETLRVTYGSGVTPGMVRMYYLRYAIVADSRDRFPDLPDPYLELLIGAVKQGLN